MGLKLGLRLGLQVGLGLTTMIRIANCKHRCTRHSNGNCDCKCIPETICVPISATISPAMTVSISATMTVAMPVDMTVAISGSMTVSIPGQGRSDIGYTREWCTRLDAQVVLAQARARD